MSDMSDAGSECFGNVSPLSMCSNDTMVCNMSTSSIFSDRSDVSCNSVRSSNLTVEKVSHIHAAIDRWKAKKARRALRKCAKRPYVARREVALRRPRTSGGKFVKSTNKFLPISAFS